MASGGIGRASALLASGTLVSRVLGFVKAIVLAQTIGVIGAGADAFANANMLPSSIYSLIAGGVLNAVLVPQVVRAARHFDGGQQYINRLVTLSIAILGGIALVATVAVPFIASLYGASIQDPELLSLVISLAYWCMPQIFFYGLYAVLGEVLNARGLFGPFTWAPVLNNVIGIAFLFMFAALYGADPEGVRNVAEWTPDMIALLGLTTTAGVACQALVLFFFWKRVGLTFRPDFRWRGTGLGKAGKLAGWTFGMLLIMQFAGLVETIVLNIAAGLTVAIAAFQNAYLIFVLPHSIITVSIATAYFTRMSAAASEHRMRDLVRDFSGGARLIGLFIVFAAWAIAVISPAFSRVFTQDQTAVTDMAIILCCFLVGLVTFCGLFLVQRAFFALEDTRTQFWLFLATMPVHVFGMAIVATLDIRFIAAGLALTQSIMSGLRLVILLWLLRRRIGHLETRRIVRSYVIYGVAAIVAALVGFGVMWLLGTYADDGFARSGIFAALVSCAIGGIIMAGVYAVMLVVLRSPDFFEAAAPILRRFPILQRFGLDRFLGAEATSGRDGDEDAADEAGTEDGGPDAPRTPGGPAPSRVGGGPEADRDSVWDGDWSLDDHRDEAAQAGDSERAGDLERAGDNERAGENEPTGDRERVGDRDAGDRERAGDTKPAGDRERVEDREPAGDREQTGDRDRVPAGSAAYGLPDEGADSEQQALEEGWSSWLDDAGAPVRQREEEAYQGAFITMGATEDLSTAGIMLPMHARSGSRAQSRRERRLDEQHAASELNNRHPAQRHDPPRQSGAQEPASPLPAPEQPTAWQEPSPREPGLQEPGLQPQPPEAVPPPTQPPASQRDAEAAPYPSDQEPVRGPEGAADRRRAQRRDAERDRLADEAFREQRRRAAAQEGRQRSRPPRQDLPAQPPARPREAHDAPHTHPDGKIEPPVNSLGGPVTDDQRDPDEDIRSLFDELFGDDDKK